jgi:hypothetical protein
MPSLSVIHLVRKKNGIAAARRFLDSYLTVPAGIAHELTVVLKGFDAPADSLETETLFKGVANGFFRSPDRDLFFRSPDRDFDIGSYLDAARASTAEHLCFTNSFSVVRGEQWLDKLYHAAIVPKIGLVGATGSWQSITTDYLDRQKDPIRRPIDAAKWLLRPLRFHAQIKHSFLPFPNPHVRTNAFVIRRDVLLQLKRGPLRSKLDAYKYESGTEGLSRQVESMGLEMRVVGVDGVAYAPEGWPTSRTFWCGKQDNLLVADNQTMTYDRAEEPMRARLRRYAWQDRCKVN